ncbi:MAG: hypothetical protein AAF513_04435 [Pseudomonadota bacterium]
MGLLLKLLAGVLVIVLTAVGTAAFKQRLADGPSRVFSGGPLLSGSLYAGPEPDWSLIDDVATIELQLVDPPLSRRLWAAQHDGRLYVWSGYMGTTVGRWWKRWPLQAQRDGRAVIRVEGVRYLRQLTRIPDGPLVEDIAAAVAAKYPSRLARESVAVGDVWLFEAEPRTGDER